MNDLHPVITEDFPLEQFLEGMSIEERRGFYKGFSKCFTTMISGLNRQKGVIRFPYDSSEFFDRLSEDMIRVVTESKEKENIL